MFVPLAGPTLQMRFGETNFAAISKIYSSFFSSFLSQHLHDLSRRAVMAAVTFRDEMLALPLPLLPN